MFYKTHNTNHETLKIPTSLDSRKDVVNQNKRSKNVNYKTVCLCGKCDHNDIGSKYF